MGILPGDMLGKRCGEVRLKLVRSEVLTKVARNRLQRVFKRTIVMSSPSLLPSISQFVCLVTRGPHPTSLVSFQTFLAYRNHGLLRRHWSQPGPWPRVCSSPTCSSHRALVSIGCTDIGCIVCRSAINRTVSSPLSETQTRLLS